MPATGDYVVDELAGTIARTPLSTMADGQPVGVSYVAQEVNTAGPDRTRGHQELGPPGGAEAEVGAAHLQVERHRHAGRPPPQAGRQRAAVPGPAVVVVG